MDENLEEVIANICIKQFESLPKTGKPKDSEWTVLSCIVLEDKNNVENSFQVVALGTGSKCIGQDKMSKSGDILNDSHGEVVCRRAFLRFLYEEMLQPQSNKNNLLIFDESTSKFCWKRHLKFHFFTTHVPCGDAAICPKNQTETKECLISDYCGGSKSKKIKLIKSDALNDVYRTGAKCLESDDKQDLRLEGAEYHVTGSVRTKPGRGVRSLSVSCSDKLAKWCYLGVQGALLSILLQAPIYLTSFIIAGGTPFNQDALERAFYNRLPQDFILPSPYEKKKINIRQSKLQFKFCKTEGKHPCPSSIIWVKTMSEKQIEVAVDGLKQGITKKQLRSGAGRLKISKIELFMMFLKVLNQFNIKLSTNTTNKVTYKDAKLSAELYQKSWDVLKGQFQVWTKKSDDLLRFCVD